MTMTITMTMAMTMTMTMMMMMMMMMMTVKCTASNLVHLLYCTLLLTAPLPCADHLSTQSCTSFLSTTSKRHVRNQTCHHEPSLGGLAEPDGLGGAGWHLLWPSPIHISYQFGPIDSNLVTSIARHRRRRAGDSCHEETAFRRWLRMEIPSKLPAMDETNFRRWLRLEKPEVVWQDLTKNQTSRVRSSFKKDSPAGAHRSR
eukprot:s87_g15.t1